MVVIAPHDSFTSKIIAEGIEYHHIDIRNYGVNPFEEIKLILQLRRLYKRIKPNMIFHYTIKPNIYGTFAAFTAKIPSIIVITGLGHLFIFRSFVVRYLTLFMYKMACKISKEVWFLNSNDLDVFNYLHIAGTKNSVILNSEGVNTKWFKSGGHSSQNGEIKFLFAGRLLEEKGVIHFAEAAKFISTKYPNVKFYLLGFVDESNPNSIAYTSILEWQSQGIIQYLGETSDVRPYIDDASCLVFPSFYREGISRILMEAASMEKPIITTDNVGCREVVDHNITGYICKPKSTKSLIYALEQFIHLPDEDKLIMGKLGRRKMIREFEEKNIIKQYLRTISKYIHISPTYKSTHHSILTKR